LAGEVRDVGLESMGNRILEMGADEMAVRKQVLFLEAKRGKKG
jgi:hypothetical protein